MRNLAHLLKNALVLKDQRGATAIEYAMVASIISVAAIVGFNNLGSQIDNRYQQVDQSL